MLIKKYKLTKIFLIILLAILWKPGLASATLQMGSPCKVNSDCAGAAKDGSSLDCEESTAPGNPSFCTCSLNKDCAFYGDSPADGGSWDCDKNDNDLSYNLHYCHSSLATMGAGDFVIPPTTYAKYFCLVSDKATGLTNCDVVPTNGSCSENPNKLYIAKISTNLTVLGDSGKSQADCAADKTKLDSGKFCNLNETCVSNQTNDCSSQGKLLFNTFADCQHSISIQSCKSTADCPGGQTCANNGCYNTGDFTNSNQLCLTDKDCNVDNNIGYCNHAEEKCSMSEEVCKGYCYNKGAISSSARTKPCGSTTCTETTYACPRGVSDCSFGGTSLCENGVCWLDEFSMKQYLSGPSILGIQAALKIINPTLQINIPDLSFSKLASTTATEENGQTYLHIPYIGEYLSAIYKFGMVAVSIIGVIMIVVVGFKITVMGGEERVNGFKRIGQIAVGLFIAWGSYAILYNINPDLVTFQALKILYIQRQELPETIDISTILASKDMQCFYDTFGSSEAEVAKQTTRVNILGVNFQVHKLAAPAFQKVATEIANNAYRAQNTKKLSSAGFVWRANVNAKSSPSLHSFGIAIDINSGANPNINCTPHEGKSIPAVCIGPRKPPVPCPHDIPTEIINAFKSNGFRWGGDYKNNCDAMHFEWLGPCAKGAPGWTPTPEAKAKANKTMMDEGYYCCKFNDGTSHSVPTVDDCTPEGGAVNAPIPGPCP